MNFNLKKDLEKINKEAKRFMKILASDSISIIIHRTKKGLGVDNKKFSDYTRPYKKYKKKKGRSNSPVNLIFRFRMLANMSPKKSSKGAKIVFTSVQERLKAYYHNYGIGQPQRQFFGLREKEKDILYKRFLKHMGRFL